MAASGWSIACSVTADRIVNPIRSISDNAKPSPSPKSAIKISIGDPTLDEGYLPVLPTQQAALQDAVAACECSGYKPTVGTPAAREAIATFWKDNFVPSEALKKDILADNVVLTSGGSHSILMAITAIANPGDNILIPAPGFPHYDTVAKTYGIEARHYHLNPDKNWEANMEEVKALKDARTKLIIFTNPSNPCGSNFTREHVEAFLRTAEELKVPMLADEIYAGMVFPNEENSCKEFTSVASIESPVPRVIICGTAKIYLVPGWRLAWLMFVDPAGHGRDYLRGIKNDANLICGPSVLAQAPVAAALLKTPSEYYARVNEIIGGSAVFFYNALNQSAVARDPKRRQLWATMPQAAMYVMVQIFVDQFDPAFVTDDLTFVAALLEEENVQCTPGTAFNAPNCFRVVITRPTDILNEALERMIAFCERHRRQA